MATFGQLILHNNREQYLLIPRPKNGFLESYNGHIHISRIYDIHRNIYWAIRTRSQIQNLKTLNSAFLCVFCNDAFSVRNSSAFCTDCSMDP